MLRTNWRSPSGLRRHQATGSGKLRRPKFTGRHKFMKRTEREALCRKLEG